MSSRREQAERNARMAAARRTGVRMTDVADFQEQSIFDEVSEEQYRKVVAERRKHKDFIAGKDALGYEDDGEDRFSHESEWFTLHDARLQLLPLQEHLPMVTASSISPPHEVLVLVAHAHRRSGRTSSRAGAAAAKLPLYAYIATLAGKDAASACVLCNPAPIPLCPAHDGRILGQNHPLRQPRLPQKSRRFGSDGGRGGT